MVEEVPQIFIGRLLNKSIFIAMFETRRLFLLICTEERKELQRVSMVKIEKYI